MANGKVITRLELQEGNYNSGLAKAGRSLRQFQQQNMTLDGAMQQSVKSIMKVGAQYVGFGAAVAGAMKVAKDAFFNNEAQLDEWGRTVEASKGLYEGFLSALNNADISGFISNMSEIVSAARDAYNALDDLNTFKAFNQVNEARNKAGYAEALATYKENPTDDNKKALKEANDKVIKDLTDEANRSEKAYEKALHSLASKRGLSGQAKEDFVELFKSRTFEELKGIRDQYQENSNTFETGYIGTEKKFRGKRVANVNGLGVYQIGANLGIKDMTKEEQQTYQMARALYQVNDEEINALQKMGASAFSLREAAAQQTRQFNRMAGNNGKVTDNKPKGIKVKPEEVYPLDSMKGLQKELQELQKEQSLATDTAEWKEYQKQIDKVADRMAILKGELPKDKQAQFTFTADISDVAEKLKDIDGVVVNPETMTITANTQEAMSKVEEATRDIEGRQVTLHVQADVDIDKLFPDLESESSSPSLTNLESAKQSLREQLASENTFIDENSYTNLLQVAVQNGIDSLDPDFTRIQEQMMEGMDVPDTAWKSLEDKINEQLAAMNIDPIKIDVKTGDVKTAKDIGAEMADEYRNAANAIGQLGAAMSSIDDPAAKVFGIVAQAIATVAQTFAASLKGTVTPWDWIAAALAGTATMISTISAIKSATAGSYAEGGFISGGAGVGDAVPILANQGEYVMNQNELGYVAGMVDSIRDNGGSGDNSNTYTTGETIVMGVNAYGRRNGWGELMFTKKR